MTRTMNRGGRRESLGEGLRSASIGPVQHVQRLRPIGPVHRARITFMGRRRALVEERGRGRREQASSAFSRDRVNEEVVRLDRQGLFKLKLVCRIAHDEIKALEDGDECELYFLPGEGAALYQKEGFLL